MKEKRKSNESSDSESEIWEYKSVKRVRKKPDANEAANPHNIAQSKLPGTRSRKTSQKQNAAKDSDSKAFKTTSNSKRNKTASKKGNTDVISSRDIKNPSSQGVPATRSIVASLRSDVTSHSSPKHQTLHNGSDTGAIPSTSKESLTPSQTSSQSASSSQRSRASANSQRSATGGKTGTGRKSSTSKKSRSRQQTPQSKIPEVMNDKTGD